VCGVRVADERDVFGGGPAMGGANAKNKLFFKYFYHYTFLEV